MINLIVICTAIVFMIAPRVRAEVDLEKHLRFPIIAVPLTANAPTIDGTVGNDEWAAASAIPDLIYDSDNTAQRNGVAAQHRTRFWLMYTAEALFVAVRCEIPEYAGPPTTDPNSWQDTVDIFLNPLGKFPPGRKWHVSGRANSKAWWRDMADRAIRQDDPKRLQYQARLFPGGWEGEMRIPFTDLLNTGSPAVGEIWQANFVAVPRVPVPSVSAWSYLKKWDNVWHGNQNGWLVFAGQPVGARFDHGANDVTRDGITITLNGTAPAEVVTQLYRRKEVPSPTDPGLMVKLSDDWDATTVGGSATWGMSFDAVVRESRQQLVPVGEPIKKQLTTADRSLAIKATELGEYLLDYSVTVPGQKLVLAAGSLPFRIEPPVNVAVNAFELKHGKRRFDVDFSTLPTLAQAKSVKLKVAPKSGGKPVATETVDAGKGMNQIELVSKDWPPNQYVASAEVCDAAGSVLGSAAKEFEKQRLPDWFTKPDGFTPEVPKPWTPVKWKDGRVEVWGRQYKFEGLPMPASVIATPSPLSKADRLQKPVELLAAPMELAVTADGKKLTWQSKEFKVESKKPSEVVFVSHNEAEGLTLKAKTKVEFDGMIRVDFSLASAGQPVKIDKLDLIIPYRGDVAELMSTYRKAPGPGNVLQGRYLGKVPAEPWKYSVYYTHFIGNNKVGLEWFCDDMRGWRVKKGDEAVEVVRAGDRVNLTFHLVDHEVTLDKPIAITFGLIATPTKPVPLSWEMIRADQVAHFPALPGEKREDGKPVTQADTDEWIRRMKYARVKVNNAFWNTWTGVDWFQYPVRHNPERMKLLKAKFDIAHSVGQKVCPWGSWYCVPTSIPEWPLWGAEMVVQPMRADLGKSYTACYNSAFTDFVVANFAQNARDVGIDGTRHDTIAPPVECNSERHGCGWRDEKGNLWPSQNLFATREYFKRLYRVFHGGVRQDGVIYFPVAGPPINAIDSFVDIHEIGEGNFERALTLKEGYPQDDVRVRHTGTAYGYVTSSNLKGHPLHVIERCAALLVAGANPRFGAVGQPNSERVGYQIGCSPMVAIWNAFEWIDLGYSSLWRPYWENADTLNLEVGGKPETYGSYYYISGKRVLLIVSNYEQEPLTGLIAKLDLRKLGFKEGAMLYGEDAITQEFVPINNGAVTLDLFPQRFRIIKISDAKPKLHPDNLGENLFAPGALDDDKILPAVLVAPKGQSEPFIARDPNVKHGGASSLRIEKTTQAVMSGATEFPPTTLAPGWYELSGYVRLDKDLGLTMENGTNPRPDYTYLGVSVGGEGVQYDPPAEFSANRGTFRISERTPGWLRFVIPFQATESTKEVKVGVALFGTGTAWVDDVEIRKLK